MGRAFQLLLLLLAAACYCSSCLCVLRPSRQSCKDRANTCKPRACITNNNRAKEEQRRREAKRKQQGGAACGAAAAAGGGGGRVLPRNLAVRRDGRPCLSSCTAVL